MGARIRRAREHTGLTQGTLAGAIGRTQTAISYWESGRRSPDIADLIALAGALDVEVGFFFGDDRARQAKRVILRAEATLRPFKDLADEIDVFANGAESLEPLPREVRITSENPTAAAQTLLAQGRVTKPPVPVEKLARLCGVHVVGTGFHNEVSGLLLDSGSNTVIGYNASHSPSRQRFTIAHELGHFLLSHHDHFHIDLSDAASHGEPPGYKPLDERAANEFAAQLLMPASMVTQFYAEDAGLERLARRFKVSREAMGWRIVNLGLLN